MALHIRDYRQSDAAGLSRLRTAVRLIGAVPLAEEQTRLLIGQQSACLAAAAWMRRKGDTGLGRAIFATDAPGWPSQILELVAEASLWLVSRGATRIELTPLPGDDVLRSGLLEMGFRTDDSDARMRRPVPARSAA